MPHTINFFFFNDTATTEIYTLSLHDALPISRYLFTHTVLGQAYVAASRCDEAVSALRSEEHTSELQSPCNIVCRLLLEKKNYHTSPLFDRRIHRPSCQLSLSYIATILPLIDE